MNTETATETEVTTEVTTETLTASEIASFMGVSPKSLRRFIRNNDAACGKGNRYAFSPAEAKALIAAFDDRPAKAKADRSADEVTALLADDEVTES